MTLHPSRQSPHPRLYGRRVMLRPLLAADFESWSEVRRRNHNWLTDWEPSRSPLSPDPSTDRDSFSARCSLRDRERTAGNAHSFGVFVDNALAGEVNLNGVVRGALQTGTVGYWIDRARAGHSFVPEAVAVLMRHAFEDLGLHRIEICIVPRNSNSRRVMEKLAIREEGTALRFLEINGVWEDHVRYGITVEEWADRQAEMMSTWISG